MSDLNPNIISLLNTLASGQFASGEALGEQLSVSRAAIAKYIKQLEQLGLDIYSVKGKGYRLAQPISLLNAQAINAQIDAPEVEIFTLIDSTNQHLLNRIGQLEKGHTCIAECQQAGRGRRGRTWVSPFASHLYLSMYWQLDEGMAAAMGLSLVTGIAVVNALTAMNISGVKLKWPNDIYVEGKKLAGILVEMSAQASGPCQLVIGLGLNVNMPIQASAAIDQPWTDIKQVAGKEIDRNELAHNVILALRETLRLYEREGLSPFLASWQKMDAFANKPVKLLIAEKEVRGIARGIDKNGALLLEANGVVKPFIGGEISLRGV
ncbi:bifunctional biotin--[acetyl-CoA-carboxylase] ligase/biotin operon repressor BirA [Motilimonas pumila]|uniref:Bifunctional ligase/repressor BirA n=1 Tax=Motilimonas pumila TaxID=2303987 RepID=A0A418YH56_9GAMM|nr:bifunctional biotin--[acetyl-CoA-carboxylase] ligase/biotin operon repressor BirA [Motilimonas pumila]RJG49384.1 bifunctional biotin--[acetyl-CoA-carboxylase] ligase/biotin operon repressor BirA [Motilimonas pumila]